MWQEIIVGICVLVAFVFLVRRWWPSSHKKAAACGGCSGCGTTSTSSCANPEDKGKY